MALREGKRIPEIERGSAVESSLWKRLWICYKPD
jgi:hypothetical protein